MKDYFGETNLQEIAEQVASISGRKQKVMECLLTHKFRTKKGAEYAHHGIARRFSTLAFCIAKLNDVLPPEETKVPSKDRLETATICIQASVFNVFGILENLAHLWVNENEITSKSGKKLSLLKIGFGPKYSEIWKSLPNELKDNFVKSSEWMEVLTSFRHSLAHRIPLYIPPWILDPKNQQIFQNLDAQAVSALKEHRFDEYESLRKQQEELKFFRPWIIHSNDDGAKPIVFHSQMIADFATVEQCTQLIVAALKDRNVNAL